MAGKPPPGYKAGMVRNHDTPLTHGTQPEEAQGSGTGTVGQGQWGRGSGAGQWERQACGQAYREAYPQGRQRDRSGNRTTSTSAVLKSRQHRMAGLGSLQTALVFLRSHHDHSETVCGTFCSLGGRSPRIFCRDEGLGSRASTQR